MRPVMPAFCTGKDTTLYIFAGCTVQVGLNFYAVLFRLLCYLFFFFSIFCTSNFFFFF
ncbi:unnamed protein product [Enterobius vermicularis]|uniref:Uncharacterized protein n=1 Tax=Enterobius vermicularis TaxID=51028 RepID=A0A0N4VPP8_ENTVE|nr:unnamed protein product [Enterobius vermicularis]